MHDYFRRMPLLLKLLLIAFLPLLFALSIAIQLYKEKLENIAQVRGYLDGVMQSAQVTRLIDQLNQERITSTDMALDLGSETKLQGERRKTDTLIAGLQTSGNGAFKNFESYTFLENIDSVRSRIDDGRYHANAIMHFYSNAVFRLSTLNKAPLISTVGLQDAANDIYTQKLLSDLITYKSLISANIYNVLYSKQFIIETLMGTKPAYDVFMLHEKELLMHGSAVQDQYKAIRQQPHAIVVDSMISKVFTTFRLDTQYNYGQWRRLSLQNLNSLRSLQMNILSRAEHSIQQYYESERASQPRTLMILIVVSSLILLFAVYMLYLINGSLQSIRHGAIRLAKGETGLKIRRRSNDAIGSLADSLNFVDSKQNELAQAAREIGQGNFAVEVKPRSKDDILGNAILKMKDDLTKSTAALQNSREEFRQLADFMPQIVWTAHGDGTIDYYNKKWNEITGITEGSGDMVWAQITHPADVGNSLNNWYHSIQTGTPFNMEYRIRNAGSGEFRWYLARAVPVKNAEGQIVKWFGTATDIHDQKMENQRLEALVMQRTADLTRSNEDLQQFAHVASHDLKEPVRKISTFCSRLAMEFGNLLPEKGKLYVSKLQTSAARMTGMIDSILNYSIVNVTERTTESVDLSIVIDDITSDLDLLILQKDARITYKNLPKLKGSSTLLYQLFYNLVSNALKFSKDDVAPQVCISAEKMAAGSPEAHKELDRNLSHYHITVQDNGIGFDQQYASKMFHIFGRLNTRDRFEGTGLGLALCMKIVHRHKGVIYAEGKEGVGSTFHIILPAEG